MAITSGVLAPFVGRMVDRAHPQPVVGFGFSALAIGLTWLSIVMTPSTAIWELILPFFVLGVAMAFIWAPLTATATRNLAPQFAGAGSGVFNATRQCRRSVGQCRHGLVHDFAHHLGIAADARRCLGSAGRHGPCRCRRSCASPSPPRCRSRCCFRRSSRWFGIGAALFLVGGSATAGTSTADEAGSDSPDAPARRVRVRPSAADGFANDFDGFRDGFDDDDDYVEYTLSPAPTAPPSRAMARPARGQVHEPRTEPLTVRIEHPRPAPAENWPQLTGRIVAQSARRD